MLLSVSGLWSSLRDRQIFDSIVLAILDSGAKFSNGFANLFHPGVGEYDLVGKHPEAAKTVKNVDGYTTAMQELKDVLSPELELISSRIINPSKEFQGVMKTIRKNITKREHKVCMVGFCDYLSTNTSRSWSIMIDIITTWTSYERRRRRH